MSVVALALYVPSGLQFVARLRELHSSCGTGIRVGIWPPSTPTSMAILLFNVVISPRIGLTMELSVALMLVVLGAMSLGRMLRSRTSVIGHDDRFYFQGNSLRPLAVGVVHGLAGSAAVALTVLATVRDPIWGVVYLAVFGIGTIAGMMLITAAISIPFAYTATRLTRFNRSLGAATALSSLVFGCFLIYRIGIVDGLFTSYPHWIPR